MPPPMHEVLSKRNLLSANMHMAESRTLIRRLCAGDESTDGIESDVKDPDREVFIHL